MNDKKLNKKTTDCYWCGEKNIPVLELADSSENGYGYYGVCIKCKRQTVVLNVEEGISYV